MREVVQVSVTPRPLADLRSLRAGGLIGTSPEITQGREIVTGAPLYAADVRLPGTQYGRVLRAPASVEVESRPLRWDLEAARAVPGFVAVVEDCGPPIGQAHGLGIVAARPGALDAIAEALEIEWSFAAAHARSDIARAVDVDPGVTATAIGILGDADRCRRCNPGLGAQYGTESSDQADQGSAAG
jgi:hypothetical protein